MEIDHLRVVERAEVGALGCRSLADHARQHIAHRLAVGEWRVWAGTFFARLPRTLSHRRDERFPDLLVRRAVAQPRARHAVRLTELPVTLPRVLWRVHVVGGRDHLPVDALHVVGLAERVDAGFPVARHRDGDDRLARELVGT